MTLKPSLDIIQRALGRPDAAMAKSDLPSILKPDPAARFPKNKRVRLKDIPYAFARTRVVTLDGKTVALGGIYRLYTYAKGVFGIFQLVRG